MPPKPEKNPLESASLDFTKPVDKLEDLQAKIEATERGIVYAEKLNDMERLGELMAKLQGFNETKKMLLAEERKDTMPSDEGVDAFTQAVGNEYGGAINKMEKRGF